MIISIDSIAFEMSNANLDTLRALPQWQIKTAKNGKIIFDEQLFKDYFVPKRGKTKPKSSLYLYLALAISPRSLIHKIEQHTTAKNATLTIQGITQYGLLDKDMRSDMIELLVMFNPPLTLKRLDIAIDDTNDFCGERQKRQIAKNTARKWQRYRATLYLKTPREKRKNRHLNIKYYHKTKKGSICWRLEFSFEGKPLKRSYREVERYCQKAINRALAGAFKNVPKIALLS